MIILLINFIACLIIYSLFQKLYMKLTGATVMFFDGRKKIITCLVLSVLLLGLGI